VTRVARRVVGGDPAERSGRWPARARAVTIGSVPSWGSFSYAFGPVVALAVVLVLALVLRWASRRGGSVVAAPARPGPPEEYGMLVPIATPATAAEAARMEQRLAGSGIACTLATTTAGLRLMVWPGQADTARLLLADGRDG